VDVVLLDVAPLETDLTYPKHPVRILDQKDCVTWRKTIKFFKVQWSNHTKEEATWDSDEFLHSRHTDFALPWLGCVRLFATPTKIFSLFKSRDEIFC
jgi:hypothetical protein